MEEPLCILVFISPDFLSLDFQTSFILISDSDFQIFAFWFPYFKLQPSCNMWQAMEERFNLCLDFQICRKGVPKNVTWRFGFASLLSSLILMLHALSGSALQIWSTRSTWGYIFVYFQERSQYPNNLSATWNSYNKDTVAFCKCEICTCECPDLMKQLVFQGYVIFICTKCWLLVDFCLKI